MQPSRTRLICRAHNRFTPSIALWQHFVAPIRPCPPQRHLSSSTNETAQGDTGSNGALTPFQEPSTSAQCEPPIEDNEPSDKKPDEKSQFRVRRLTTVKGRWLGSKAEVSRLQNIQAQYDSRQESFTEPEKLLDTAKAAFEAAEDYEGVVVKPRVNPTPVRESSLPWCLPPDERTMAGIDRLAVEMEKFHDFVRPGRFEAFARKHLIEQVRSHVRATLPNHVLELFGSERNGIALATSDIDFRLVGHPQRSDSAKAKMPPTRAQRSKAMKDLHVLRWNGLNYDKAYLVPMIRYARYPLVSLQDKQSGLDVQIVLSNDTSISRVIMQGYMEEYPYLRQLYFVVKTMFDVRGLSDVFRGGFGSYSLFMMTVASLRHNPHPRNDAAGGLVNFLKFWRDFDTRKQGISIEPVYLFDKASEPILPEIVKSKLQEGTLKALPEYMLSLRDPADNTNDLGRKGVAIKHVQATFRSILQRLETDLSMNTRASLLGPLVGPSYMLDRARRRKLERYGKYLMHQMENSLAMKANEIRDAESAQSENVEDYEATQNQFKRGKETQPPAREGSKQGDAVTSILGMPSVREDANTGAPITWGSRTTSRAPEDDAKETSNL